MVQPLNFTLPIASLKHLSAAKLGISLICAAVESDVIAVNSIANDYEQMKNNRIILLDRAKCVIPQPLMDCFGRLLYDILLELHNEWDTVQVIFRQGESKLLPDEIFRHFRFSSRGMVDPLETCANIVHDETLDLVFRYRLACYFYQEETIQALWRRMKSEDFHKFDAFSIIEIEHPEVIFWSLKMLDFELNPWFPELTPNASAFKESLEDNDEYAAKYIFKKLNETEKKAVLDHFDPNETFFGTKTFCFAFLTGPQLEKVLKDDGVVPLFKDVIISMQNELLPQLFESLRPFVDEESYFQILLMLSELYDFIWDIPVFDVMWTQVKVPDSYRDYVLSKPGDNGTAHLLCNLIYNWAIPSCKWSIDDVTRYIRKEQFEIIFVGALERIQCISQDKYKDSDEIKLLMMCARKMVTSNVELDYVQKAASHVLDHEESWKSFLESMKRKLKSTNERKRQVVDVKDTVLVKKHCRRNTVETLE